MDIPLPPNILCISTGYVCTTCVNEANLQGVNIVDYQRVLVGLTPFGFQVWCVRHGLNVAHVAFGQHELPINLTAQITMVSAQAPASMRPQNTPTTPPPEPPKPRDPNAN